MPASRFITRISVRCRQAGRVDEAVSEAGCALANIVVLNNLGIAHYDRDEDEQAIEYYQRAMEVQPAAPQAYSNLGNALLALGKPVEALPYYRHAIAVDPDYVDAHNNLAMILLLTGDFADGWPEFEWRHRRRGRDRFRLQGGVMAGRGFRRQDLARDGGGEAWGHHPFHALSARRRAPRRQARGGRAPAAARADATAGAPGG